jgi:hypothetical protein
VSLEQFIQRLPSPPTPATIGEAVVALHENPAAWPQVGETVTAWIAANPSKRLIECS